MATVDERMEISFSQLAAYAAQLAESWRNGNRSDVLAQIESAKPALVVLVACYISDLTCTPEDLAQALHKRTFD